MEVMNKEELDRIYEDVNWQITKRSGVAAVKAFTIGSESLDTIIAAISTAYGLSEKDQQKLRPSKSIDVNDGLSSTVDGVKKMAGLGVGTLEAGKIARVAKLAHKNGHLLTTARAFAAGGLKGAGQAARTGATAAKGVPWIAVAAGAYAVGTAGWFARKAYLYNKACYELLLERLESATMEE